MKKHIVLGKALIIIVCIIGIVPGLWTMLINVEGPFQRPDGPYWKALVIGIPSVLAAIIAGYPLSKFLLEKWYNESKSIVFQSFIAFSITIIAGLVAVMIGCEVNWIVQKAFGWGAIAQVQWIKFLIGIPIIFFYSIVPVGIAGLLFGLFSFIYLKLSKG